MVEVMSTRPLPGLRRWCFKTLEKKNNRQPVTSKIYYEPEMTFGAKSETVVKSVGRIYYRFDTGNVLRLQGSWWHFKGKCAILDLKLKSS